MQFSEDNKLELLMEELEHLFRQFKKIDIFRAVSKAYKNVRPFRHILTAGELEKIKLLAIQDLKTG